MEKTNHRRTLRQAKKVLLMPGEPLKESSQRNQWMKSNDLLAKLALPPQPASSFIKNLVFFHHYNNLIHVFALSSVRNSIKFSQWCFYKLATVFCFITKAQLKKDSSNIIIALRNVINKFFWPIRITNFITWLIVIQSMDYIHNVPELALKVKNQLTFCKVN